LTPVKHKLIQLITEIQTHRDRKVPKDTELTRMTTEDLKQMLFKKASGIKVVIAFNHLKDNCHYCSFLAFSLQD
jgi:hypothetical protein